MNLNQAVFMEISDSDQLFVAKGLEENNKFLLVSGLPLNEPIAAYGPFVMNTNNEIRAAFDDYHNSKNGFEGSNTWNSEIKQLMKQ